MERKRDKKGNFNTVDVLFHHRSYETSFVRGGGGGAGGGLVLPENGHLKNSGGGGGLQPP